MSVWLLRSVVRFLLRVVSNTDVCFCNLTSHTNYCLKRWPQMCWKWKDRFLQHWVGTCCTKHEAGDFGIYLKGMNFQQIFPCKPSFPTPLELAVHHWTTHAMLVMPGPCGSVYHRFHTRLQLPLKGSKRWTPARYVNLYHLNGGVSWSITLVFIEAHRKQCVIRFNCYLYKYICIYKYT